MGGKCRNFLDLARSRCAVWVLIAADSAAVLLSIIVGLRLRFDDLPWGDVYDLYLRGHLLSLPAVLVIYLAAFASFRLYRCAWRFASLEMVWGVVCANTVGLVGMVAAQLAMDGGTLPRSVLVMTWTGGVVLTGAERVALRVLSVTCQHGRLTMRAIRREPPRKRVVILGAGADGVAILRSIREDPHPDYEVVGFLDDNPRKQGLYISNVRVLGPISHITRLLDKRSMDAVIVAVPELTEKVRQHIVECRKHKLPVKVVPRMRDMLRGRAALQLVDFSVEDLLRRAPATRDASEIGGYLTDRRVLVTGAGGSIGSELCRQIASLRPASLVLLGHGENSIHQIYNELRSDYPEIVDRVHYTIASVAHSPRIEQVFDKHRPHVVFHAAAHKHVPMMECNEQEAVHNNVLGTRCVAEACGRYGVETVVLISTDKAADPCSIMGATKWLCEEIFRAMACYRPRTSYVAVRFGNVLGSRGSVVPVFCEQIRRGGPVTVTHPEMTRYFMTIPEAVRLVLEAGAVGQSGEVYLLDMGRPVKIVDLAREIVRLNGLEPEHDIKFEFTGIRSGEKLHEQLISEQESLEPTEWKGLSLIRRPRNFTPGELIEVLQTLEQTAANGSAEEVRDLLYEIASCPRHARLELLADDESRNTDEIAAADEAEERQAETSRSWRM